MLFYFALGTLNVVLLYIFSELFKRSTGIDLFPGRENGDKLEMGLNIVAFFITGHFGTLAVCVFGLFLLMLWLRNH